MLVAAAGLRVRSSTQHTTAVHPDCKRGRARKRASERASERQSTRAPGKNKKT